MAAVNSYWYHKTVSQMREFFISKGFIEVCSQAQPSLLSCCDDPSTITTYSSSGEKWLLPQTSQVILERELLKNPDTPGFFSCSTSYRHEKNPIPGRHEHVFPIFEFETHGDMTVLQRLEEELLVSLGFDTERFLSGAYDIVAAEFDVKGIGSEVEEFIGKEKSSAFFLNTFPEMANPLWNIRRDGAYARKIDVILYGMETIDSAERSCNVGQMRESFYLQNGGVYAQSLFDLFGRDRVEAELERFLSLEFFPRCGGSIGVTRMIRALKLLEADERHGGVFVSRRGADGSVRRQRSLN